MSLQLAKNKTLKNNQDTPQIKQDRLILIGQISSITVIAQYEKATAFPTLMAKMVSVRILITDEFCVSFFCACLSYRDCHYATALKLTRCQKSKPSGGPE